MKNATQTQQKIADFGFVVFSQQVIDNNNKHKTHGCT